MEKHRKNLELRRKHAVAQAQLEDVGPQKKPKPKSDVLMGVLSIAFFSACISWNALNNPEMRRDFLEMNVAGTLPDKKTLHVKYFPESYDNMIR